MAVNATCITVTKVKPMASVNSRSRSALTSALSTTNCMKKGCSRKKTSIASARANNCPRVRLSPTMRPATAISGRRGGAACGAKSCVGVSSSATPEKCSETAFIGMRRAPSVGSWTTISFLRTSRSTTKWFRSQCRMQGNCS